MLVLQTLGILDLRRSDGTAVHSVLRQPKRTALLVYLAASRQEYLRRDMLLPLFWPESTEASARHALAQALYALRRSLEAEFLETRGVDELRLRPDVLSFDVTSFREALASGRHSDAREIYIGDFLNGLHVAEADGFQRWVDSERQALRRDAAASAWSLALEQIRRGSLTEAERSARRAFDLEPSDESSVRVFLRELGVVGAVSSAVLFYEHVRTVLKEQFEFEPADETRLTVDSLRVSVLPAQMADVASSFSSQVLENERESMLQEPTKSSAAVEPEGLDVIHQRLPLSQNRLLRWRMYVGAAAAIAIAGTAALAGRWRSESRVINYQIGSLAVMPLINHTRDSTQEYFVDGMYDALIAELTQIQHLRVISRTSAERYIRGQSSLQSIGRDLNVDAVIQGDVSRAGKRVSIKVELLRLRPERVLWSRTYDREESEVLALHRDLARAVANEIQLDFSPPASGGRLAARSVEPAAYDAWLRGAYHAARRSGADMEACIRYARQSVAADPSYAPAFQLLARCYNISAFVSATAPEDAFDEAKRAAHHALQLDETFAPAHAELAWALAHHDWDWAAAERSYRKALELNPGLDGVEEDFGWLLSWLGRFDEALVHARKAEDLNPMSPQAVLRVGMILHLAGRYSEALEKAKHAIALDSAYMFAYDRLHWAYYAEGRHQEGLVAAKHAVAVSGDKDMRRRAFLAHAYALAGNRPAAQAILNELLELQRDTYVPPTAIAAAYVGLGNTEQALRWLERGFAGRDGDMVLLKTFCLWDPLRAEPRFAALIQQMKYPR